MASIDELRDAHYNATVVNFRRVHEDLLIMGVLADTGHIAFLPGQYTVLGLGAWEPYVGDEQYRAEGESLDDPSKRLVPDSRTTLIRRAYSFSAAMVDSHGELLPPDRQVENEFYIALVRASETHAPTLTPRIFKLDVGSRIHIGRNAKGTYTLAAVAPTDTVIFCATGTGEAPHNTMVAHLLATGHAGRIIAIACVRHHRDLAYFDAQQILQNRYAQYQYITLTTREPENLDSSHPHYVGKRHIQHYFESGDFERDTGITLEPSHTHVYLCGNPAMIGIPNKSDDPTLRYPVPKGMVEVLERRGFTIDQPRSPGNIHFEKYW